VELAGPARDSVALELPLPPRALSFEGEGWAATGFRPDAAPPASLRLDRQMPQALAAETASASDLAPWLELRRTLDVGIPWLLTSELRRLGPPGEPVAVRVPLLAGEAVTSAGVAVEGGEALVTLERAETVRLWRSILAEAASLTLTAPAGRPWLERWSVGCSPVWTCRAEGIAPTRHMEEGLARPLWQPWPGEAVTLHFVRAGPAPGPTLTLDRVGLALTPGRRLREATLTLEARASKSGELALVLPAAAVLQSFAVDGRSRPVQFEQGRLRSAVEPGRHEVEIRWREPHGLGLVERTPAVELGAEAANVSLDLAVPDHRWLLWASGPRWGPVVTLWLYLPLLALLAFLLGRQAPTPLATADWLLLGAGLTQVPLAAAAAVVLWLVLLGARHRLPGRRWWSHDFQQLGLALLAAVALAVLYTAVHAGLLGRPEMQVTGPGSQSSLLHWYRDRAAGALPSAWALWLPLWFFRLLMLLWALWLALRLLSWLPWAWRRFAGERAWAWPRSEPRAATPAPPPP
jgi:hypothetical protein